jgi:hypothetical protein
MFTATPPMKTGEAAAAQRLADRRMDSFMDRLASQVATGRRLLQEALEEIVPEPGDFASLSDIDFSQPIPRRRGEGAAPKSGASASGGAAANGRSAPIEGEERSGV